MACQDSSIFPIEIQDLDNFIEQAEQAHHLDMIYEMLSMTKSYPTAVGSKPEQRNKNRNQNILPYDENRVKLDVLPDDPNSHYINASLIQSEDNGSSYVAAQAPPESGLNDFWRMIWEYEIQTIVMLTRSQENKQIKCPIYWPRDTAGVKFGSLEVSLDEEEINPEYTMRRISMKGKRRVQRSVVLLQFKCWPDQGVPSNLNSFMDFLDKVRVEMRYASTPLLVHGCTGAGRTGTFIAIDQLINQSESKRVVDVPYCVYQLRTQRGHMVQNINQFRFIFKALQEYIRRNPMLLKTPLRRKRLSQVALEDESPAAKRLNGPVSGPTDQDKEIRENAAKFLQNSRCEARKALSEIQRQIRSDILNDLTFGQISVAHYCMPASEITELKRVFDKEWMEYEKHFDQEWVKLFEYEWLVLENYQKTLFHVNSKPVKDRLGRRDNYSQNLKNRKEILKVIKKLKKPVFDNLESPCKLLAQGLEEALDASKDVTRPKRKHKLFHLPNFRKVKKMTPNTTRRHGGIVEEQNEQNAELEQEQAERLSVEKGNSQMTDEERIKRLRDMDGNQEVLI